MGLYGYIHDRETKLYYLQSRYYNPELGRFINADALVATGQGILGNNAFCYCLNNPANCYDYSGFWTFSISLGANVTFALGISVSIGLAVDDKGNLDWQWSYVVPGVDDTSTVGAVDAGIGVSLQVTDCETVYDLYGPATYIGASGGPGWYVGADLVSFSDASDLTNEVNGIQLTAGLGVGVDVHVTESYTRPVKDNSAGQKRSQQSSRRSTLALRL